MTKSRVESAVQELPPRGARSRSDISALRPLDHLLRGPDKSPAVVVPEALGLPRGAGSSVPSVESSKVDTFSIEEASIEDILFDEVVDEAELGEHSSEGPESPASLDGAASSLETAAYDAPGYYETSPEPRDQAWNAPPETDESGAAAHEGRAFRTFSEAAIDDLLDELRISLSSALADAERVLGEPERVAFWFEMQARKRLLSLSARLSDELRATEVKKVLTSPPSKPVP